MTRWPSSIGLFGSRRLLQQSTPVLDVQRRLVLRLPRLDRLRLGSDLVDRIVHPNLLVGVRDERLFGAVEGGPDPVRPVHELDAEGGRELAIIPDAVDHVRRLPVLEVVLAAVDGHALGGVGPAEPLDDVELVGPDVGHEAAGVVPEPPPRPVPDGVERPLRGLAQEGRPIDLFFALLSPPRRRGERVFLDPVAAVPDLGPDEVAEVVGVDHVPGPLPVRAAVPLVADLDDPLGPPDGLDHLLAFLDRLGQRLLDVGVFFGLHDGQQHVPVVVVRGGDDDGVEPLVVEQLAVVVVERRLVLAGLGDGLGQRPEAELGHVAQGHAAVAELHGLP